MRQIRRTLASPKGKVLGGAGALLVVLWGGALLFQGAQEGTEVLDAARGWVPLLIIVTLVSAVLRSSGDRAMSFSPAEVHFLFSGPFSRRQLLLYRIAVLTLTTLGLSVILTLMGAPHLGSGFRSFPGILSALLVAQFLSLFLALLRERIGLVLSGRLLWGIGVLVVLLAASGLVGAAGSLDPGNLQGMLEAVRSGPGWRAIELALSPFTMAIIDPTPAGLMVGLAGATAINGAIVGAILLLDANYLEAASRIGERTYANMEKAKAQGIAQARPSRGGGHRRVPPLPHWGGAGTIAWRQLTALRRGSFGFVLLFLAGAVAAGMWIALSEPETVLVIVVGVMMLPLVLMVADALRFDFRGDLEVLEALKSMPLHSTPMVLGQIAVPTLLLTFALLALLGPPLVAAGYAGALPLAGIPVLLISTLVFGVKNYLFLHFPVSLRERNPADLRFLGRTVLFLLIEGIVVAGAVGVSVLLAGIASAPLVITLNLLGAEVSTAGFLAIGGLAFGVALGVPIFVTLRMAGRAYERLDPSRLLRD